MCCHVSRWFRQCSYKYFSDLPDELQVLFDQVNTFLGHDATCHMFYTIACTIGLAKPFVTLNQYESLVSINFKFLQYRNRIFLFALHILLFNHCYFPSKK